VVDEQLTPEGGNSAHHFGCKVLRTKQEQKRYLRIRFKDETRLCAAA